MCPLGSGLDLARIREKSFLFNGGGLPNVLKERVARWFKNQTFRVEVARNRITLEFHEPGNVTAVRWRTLMCVVSHITRSTRTQSRDVSLQSHHIRIWLPRRVKSRAPDVPISRVFPISSRSMSSSQPSHTTDFARKILVTLNRNRPSPVVFPVQSERPLFVSSLPSRVPYGFGYWRFTLWFTGRM